MRPEHEPTRPRFPARVAEPATQLTGLVYELLDAHLDTEQLMGEPSTHLEWLAHLHYLRDLQRSAREALARATAT
jgi:hypothetical protein